MIGELGLIGLILAFLLSLAQATAPLYGAQRGDARLMLLADYTALGQFVFTAFSFACLIIAFARSDFSLEVVAANSHSAKPLFYKIAAAWGHHEGSMLLWTLVMALFGALAALFGGDLPSRLKARVLAVQAMLSAGFFAFLLFTSNPFARLADPPAEGAGFNPLLQDPGLAIHPPTLYLGYVGLSITFSFSIAALIEGRVDVAWARWVRPWALAAWSFLTLGIMLGSLWAYYELGWGGWWYWDPVENASFMPWLVTTALLHCALVVERRHMLVNWTMLLSILAFTLSVIGAFLVRSGVLTSVHSFALDPARGVFILAIILAIAGGGFTLYGLRAGALARGPGFAAISRENALLANNLLIICACATVFLGTFYPLIAEALFGDKVTVGPPFFERTFGPIMALLALVMAFGPLLRWRSDRMSAALRPMRLGVVVAGLLGIGAALAGKNAFGGLGAALAVLTIASVLTALARRVRLGEAPLKASLAVLAGQPAGQWGFLISHTGMGVLIAGVAAMSAWAQERTAVLTPGESLKLGGYEARLIGVTHEDGVNYASEIVQFEIMRDGRPHGALTSAQRFYPERQSVTTEAGIRPGLVSYLHIAATPVEGAAGFTVRFSLHPLVGWIWAGAALMAFGGFISLADRRLRVGAPHKAAAQAAPA